MEKVLTDIEKQQCTVTVLTEEYKRINDEILKRIDYLDKNINYQFVLLGIVATAIGAVWHNHDLANPLEQTKYILLISPIIFNLLGFYYSINNMYTFKISQYITNYIKPKLDELLGTNFILGYDHYIQSEVFKKARKSSKAVSFIVLQWTISIPLILLGSYLFLKFSGTTENLFGIQLFLLVVNVILLILSVRINFDQYNIIFRNR